MSNFSTGTTTGTGSGTYFIGMSGTSTSTNMWGDMQFKEANEAGETIEMIYTQSSLYSRTGGLPPYFDERVVKIVYSCKDGKWNKSEPIYGKIIPMENEYYEFED